MKLKKFMLTTELTTLLLPLCLIALAAFYIATDSLKQEALQKNDLIARATANQLEMALQNPQKLLQQAHASCIARADRSLPMQPFLEPMLRIEPLFQKIEVLNKQGKILETVPPDLQMLGLDRSGQEFFKALQAGKAVYWSNAFISLPQGHPSVVLAMSFADRIIAAHLNLSGLHTLIDTMQEKHDPGMSIAVADYSGVYISHHDSQRVLERRTLEDYEEIGRTRKQYPGVTSWENDSKGQLISLAQVASTGWLVVVTQSNESAYATVTKLQRLFLVIVLLSIGGAVVASRYKSAYVVRSFAIIENALIQARDSLEIKVQQRTEELSVANEDLTAMNEEINAINEELQTLNQALTTEIESRQLAEAGLQQAKLELEHKVAERTAELLAANQTLHATIDDLQAEITARLAAEINLAETEKRYQAVLRQSTEAVLLCDVETAEILDTNSRFTKLFGFDRGGLKSTTLFDLTPQAVGEIHQLLSQVRKAGFLRVQRYTAKHKSGRLVDVEVAATLIRHQNRLAILLTFRDVTDAVRRERQTLRESQLATRVQDALLELPAASDFIELKTLYQPFGYVGGDLYFLDWRYDGMLLRGFLVDVAGHGLATALHTSSLHVLLREVNERDLPLSDAMRWINQRAGEYFDEATFAGAIGFELDLETQQLRWSCAGLPELWLSTAQHTGVLRKPGLFLGIRENETFDTHVLPLAVGDSFYFLTDGLTDLLSGSNDLPLAEFPAMLNLLAELSQADRRRDDATAICIRIRALPSAAASSEGWPRLLRFNNYGDYQRLKGEIAKILAEAIGLPHSLPEVAVNEALANAMECRDGAPRQHAATIKFNKFGRRLVVRVRTSRLGFAGNALLRRLRSHPEELFVYGEDASMGRGIPIMLSTSDRMCYNSEGTEVLLAWRLKE
jgi:PAS domain S-box-containing protein